MWTLCKLEPSTKIRTQTGNCCTVEPNVFSNHQCLSEEMSLPTVCELNSPNWSSAVPCTSRKLCIVCTCIYCVLYCLYCVFVLFRLCVFILVCSVCTGIRTAATEWQLNCSNNNNNNNNIKIFQLLLLTHILIAEWKSLSLYSEICGIKFVEWNFTSVKQFMYFFIMACAPDVLYVACVGT